jgi:predicted alpha/beta-hydrolase family hydrolase
MPTPSFLFAPGAGAPSTHPWMQRWADLLRTLGPVQTLDYPYMLAHKGRPDPLPRLIAAHREALETLRATRPGPVILIGKSMGSRVGCHVALAERVHAVVCLGYPLCGAGDRRKLRDQVLRDLTTPILFVQGTRDSLCPLDLLADVRAQMPAFNQLEIVEAGDHSLRVTQRQLKAGGEAQADVEARVLRSIAAFIGERDAPADR